MKDISRDKILVLRDEIVRRPDDVIRGRRVRRIKFFSGGEVWTTMQDVVFRSFS